MAAVTDIIHKLTYEANTDVVTQLNKEFGKQFQQIEAIEKEVQELDALLQKTGKDDIKTQQTLNGLLAQKKKQIDSITQSIVKQVDGSQKLTKAVNGVGIAFANIVRDAPFGIIGIGNNITQTFDAISTSAKGLRAQGATTGQIFATLGGSLLSLNTALSVGITLLTVFGDKIFNAGQKAEEAKDEVDELIESIGNLSEGAVSNIDQQVSSLEVLKRIIMSNSAASSDAFKKLKEDYPVLLKNIKDETQLRSNPQLFDAIQRQIEARERGNTLTKQAVEFQKLERIAIDQVNKSKEEELRIQKEINDVRNRRGSTRDEVQFNKDLISGLEGQLHIQRAATARLEAQAAAAEKSRSRILDLAAAQTTLGRTLEEKEKDDKTEEKALREKRRLIEAYKKSVDELNESEIGLISTEQSRVDKATIQFANQVLRPRFEQELLDSRAPKGDVQLNAILEAQQEQKKIDEKKKKEEEKRRKEAEDSILKSAKTVRDVTIQYIQDVLQAQINALDTEIAIRQTRQTEAIELAKFGNTEILREETQRLEDAQAKREEVAQKQLALNALLQASAAGIAAAQALQTITNAGATGDPYTTAARIAAAVAALAAGFAFVTNLANAARGFKDGVIGLDGPGTSTSDSIHARLSKGESVMTAKETQKYRPYLEAMREGTFNKMIGSSTSMRMDGVESKLDALIEVTGANKTKVVTNIGKRGVHQMIEQERKIDRSRWR